MCGILATTGDSSGTEAALLALGKRGPDDHGVMRFDGATLAQTRLAIVDLSPGGHQPMRDNAQDIAITFNGEIYNYKELRQELEAKGHRFSSRSDTEVILKAYVEYGEECPKYLDGMFAFALWDNTKKQLFLARDRFGKKPLYYAYTKDGALVAASEIKALRAMGVRPVLDPAGLDLYLTLMYLPPWRSVYKNIFTILPAHCATFKDGALSTARYWALEKKPLALSYAEAKEELRRLLTAAVQKRMIADVEIGSLLSGGVDSTLVTAYAQKCMDRPIKTFALGYGDYINELPFAEAASKKIGTDHHTLQATSDIIEELEKVIEYFDEPHGDSADFPQHMVSELAASKVKVALAGDGGDELFLGYGNYFAYWNRPKLVRLKNALFSNPYREHIKSITVFPARLRRTLLKDNSHVGKEAADSLVPPMPNGLDKINMFDITTYLPGQLLAKVDQTSMMHGLEIRCPLLDHHLAEFAYNLPTEYKTDRTTGKLILKDLLREIMPSEFVDRKKQGFGAPVRRWFAEPHMRAYVEKQFAPGAPIFGVVHESAARAHITKTLAGNNPKSYYQLWVLLCLAVWMQKHKDDYDL